MTVRSAAPANQNTDEDGQTLTTSGIELSPLYTPLDVSDFDYQRDAGDPGSFPFTRGTRKQAIARKSGQCAR